MKLSQFQLVAIALVATILPIVGQMYGDRAGGWLMVDFRAYYCAASAQRAGENPYFVQSVHACESAPVPPYYRAPAKVTVPTPYPPYALGLLYPVTFLPFGVAAILWWLVIAGSIVLASFALARVCAQPWLVGWNALILSLGLTTFTDGNVMPISLAAIVVAALALQNARPAVAAVAIAIAMIEPHVALPAAVAIFIGYPKARIMLVAAAAVVGAISLAAGGIATNLEYLTAVVPAHALSEVSRDNQYSLSTIVAAFGASDAQAVLIGSISYVVMLAAGVLVGFRLAQRYDDPAFAALTPVAFSLLGGSFVHTAEIAAAVPACLLLYARTPVHREAIVVVLILLAVPWMMATSIALILAPIFPVAYFAYTLGGRDSTATLVATLASLMLIMSLFALYATSGSAVLVTHHVHPWLDPRLAEASWRDFVLNDSTNRPIMWFLRAPTWLGLIAFIACAIGLLRSGRRVLSTESA